MEMKANAMGCNTNFWQNDKCRDKVYKLRLLSGGNHNE